MAAEGPKEPKVAVNHLFGNVFFCSFFSSLQSSMKKTFGAKPTSQSARKGEGGSMPLPRPTMGTKWLKTAAKWRGSVNRKWLVVLILDRV